MNNCFLIGENQLTIQCAQILLKNNYNFLGIISEFSDIEDYAIENRIPFFKSLEEAENTIFKSQIDYFF